MKAVILAGGFGTRLAEETETRPKPMVEIGDFPIIWHVMKIYSVYGINDFIICLGYKGYIIKEYFINYHRHVSDVTVDTLTGAVDVHRRGEEAWRVTLVETGLNTMTGGRIKRVRKYLGDETFLLTYGDGVANINVRELVANHEKSGALATVTAVQPPSRFGTLEIKNQKVVDFREKPVSDGGAVNGGFFVLSPKVLDYIAGDDTVWEGEPLQSLAKEGNLNAYLHKGFWHPMDTLRDKRYLDDLWRNDRAPWRIW